MKIAWIAMLFLLLPLDVPAQFTTRPVMFPAAPDLHQPRYVVFSDHCGGLFLKEPIEIGRNPESGLWRLELQVLSHFSVCFATPAEFSGKMHAIELPQVIDESEIEVYFAGYSGPSPDAVYFDGVLDSRRWGIPPSIGGIWRDPAHPAQGLHISHALIGSDAGLVMSWDTYDVDGASLWLVGAGSFSYDDRDANKVRIPLSRTLHGTFPGRIAGAQSLSVAPWGEATIEYLGCGRLKLHWTSNDASAFPSDVLILEQFAPVFLSQCDLNQLARNAGKTLAIHQPIVVE